MRCNCLTSTLFPLSIVCAGRRTDCCFEKGNLHQPLLPEHFIFVELPAVFNLLCVRFIGSPTFAALQPSSWSNAWLTDQHMLGVQMCASCSVVFTLLFSGLRPCVHPVVAHSIPSKMVPGPHVAILSQKNVDCALALACRLV